jgi:hypothetical protein
MEEREDEQNNEMKAFVLSAHLALARVLACQRIEETTAAENDIRRNIGMYVHVFFSVR